MGVARKKPLNGLAGQVEEKPKATDLTDAEKTINQRIAYLRKVKRLTQKELAEKLNVSDKLVSKWEQEGSTPALEDVVNICKIFNLSLDYLVHGKKSLSDAEALTPLPPPPPHFVDPVQTLLKTIDELINKNHLQKYREQLFPGFSGELLYGIIERLRKATLEDWNAIPAGDMEPDRKGFDSAEQYCRVNGDWWYIFREEYREDLRSAKKPIDERYWAQVQEYAYSGYGAHNHGSLLSKEDSRLLKNGFGIFSISGFGYHFKKIGADEYRMDEYGISFGINFDALLSLNNFEIYSKIVASGVPLYCTYYAKPKLNDRLNYFSGLSFDQTDYEELYKKIKTSYGSLKDSESYVRDMSKVPLTYKEMLGLTDFRFFGLLPKNELDMLLEHIDTKHKKVWEITVALIEAGATRKRAVDCKGYCVQEEDPLGTLMLYEIAKMKMGQ